jgi:hypothetical protein
MQALLKELNDICTAIRLEGAEAVLTSEKLHLWEERLGGLRTLVIRLQGEQQMLGMKVVLFEDHLLEIEQTLVELKDCYLSSNG